MSFTRTHICGGTSGEQCGDDNAQMHYACQSYAKEVVIKNRCKIASWPEHIPFKSASEIRGGVRPLLELRRRWSLPDGHEDKLRIVRATPEDVANAARDPDSVHPNLKLLQEERKAAAAAAARVTAQATAYVVPVFVWHPLDSSFVGLDFTSAQTRTSGTTRKRPRGQRSDTCKRRKRASDTSLQVRKRLPMRGVISMRSVIPGVDGTAGGDERAAKRARLDDCPVEDTIEDFVLSSEFGGRLSLA